MEKLYNYLNSEKELEREFAKIILENINLFDEILDICGGKFYPNVGSYFFDGKTYKYCDKMIEKQFLLYEKIKEQKNVLEIGTYMGHSLLIMLLSNPKLKITSIDIDDTFSLPVINFLNKKFNTNIKFIKGNSLDALKLIYDQFDFFHIDGTHNIDFVVKELDFCKNMSTSDTLNVIFDDYDTIKDIKEMIEKNHIILEQVTPNCSWRNSFMKIKL